MADFVRTIRRKLGRGLDAHCHNDHCLALANSLAGIGADQIHVTVNGIDERTGIPALIEAAVAINRRPFMPSRWFRLKMLCGLSRRVVTYARLPTHEN